MSSQTNVYRANPFSFFLCLFILSLSTHTHAQKSWHTLSPGIEYLDLKSEQLNPWAHIYVFKIDLNKNKLGLITAKSLGQKHASADQFAEHSHALLSINGGFFDTNFQPLGLRINDHKIINPLKQISWWGVFYTQNHKAYLTQMSHFKPNADIDFAVQSGPRLIINGTIPSLKEGLADRSALGITSDGFVILLVSTNVPMTTNELAHVMKSPPLSCIQAINLDGGSSSQLFAHINAFNLNVYGFTKVSDAIIVKNL